MNCRCSCKAFQKAIDDLIDADSSGQGWPLLPVTFVLLTDEFRSERHLQCSFPVKTSSLVREENMSRYELAQLNIAMMKEPLESPAMADFVANLDRINALAENSPGFVWRLQTYEGDATSLRPLGPYTLVNMSVWRDFESLNTYVYQSAHVDVMRRRNEWFYRMQEAYVVLWWVPKGHRPDIEEAVEMLEQLRAKGPTADAFTFRHSFPAPDASPASQTPVV